VSPVAAQSGGLFNRQIWFLRGFWSAVWRALLDTDRINEVRWNLPLAMSLRGHKRASDNARKRGGGSPSAIDREDWLSP
jgi:hypothetical protein